MKSKSNVFWGMIIIGVGLFVLSNMMGLHFSIASSILHLIIGGLLIVYGVCAFAYREWKFLPFFTFYVGIGFIVFTLVIEPGLLGHLETIDSPWALIGPAAILAVGSSLLFKNVPEKEVRHSSKKEHSDNTYQRFSKTGEKNHFTEVMDTINIQNMMNSTITVATSKHFQGGFISSRFSETVVDLKQIKLVNDATLTIDNIFGSVKITVPENVNVKLVATSNVLASITEYGTPRYENNHYQLVVNVDVKFGSVEIHYV